MQTDFHTPNVAVLAGLERPRDPLMGQPFRLNGIAAIMFETRLQARLYL